MKTFARSDAAERYKKKLQSLAPIPDESLEHLTDVMQEKHFSKGEVILREGQVCKNYYFILSGCIRGFCLKEGREVNVNFYFEDDTACDFASFRTETPSEYYLIAMEECTVYCASKELALPVFQQDSALHIFLFRFFQDLYFKEEVHSNSFKLLSPEERYNYLLEHNPEYLQRVPMIHLASYLGISRETLTRIRKKIS